MNSELEKAMKIVRDNGYMWYTMWTWEDVLQVVRNEDINIPDELLNNPQFKAELIRRIEDFDADLGVNWDHIKTCITEMLNK